MLAAGAQQLCSQLMVLGRHGTLLELRGPWKLMEQQGRQWKPERDYGPSR